MGIFYAVYSRDNSTCAICLQQASVCACAGNNFSQSQVTVRVCRRSPRLEFTVE